MCSKHKKTVSEVMSCSNGSNEGFKYWPKLSVRCLSTRNDPFDNSTSIWSSAFPTKTCDTFDKNRFAATCGANTVCIIDCKQSIEKKGNSVVGRYIDHNSEETFVCLAWTLFSLTEGHNSSKTLILAVGGKTSFLLMTNFKELHCYERVKAHSDQINALVFAQNGLLFTASYDQFIKLWQISGPNNNNKTQLLRSVNTNNNLLSICFSKKHQMVCASGLFGLYFWRNPLNSSNVSNGQDEKTEMRTKSLVDGLVLIPENEDLIAIRIHSTKSISIIDLKKVVDKTHKTDNNSKIMSISLSKVLKVKLQSFDFKYPFIYLSAQKNLLISGGPKGEMWAYDTTRLSQFDSKQLVKPDHIFGWPQIENIKKDNKFIVDEKKLREKNLIINSVAISPNLNYLIGCTSLNLILIWRKIIV